VGIWSLNLIKNKKMRYKYKITAVFSITSLLVLFSLVQAQDKLLVDDDGCSVGQNPPKETLGVKSETQPFVIFQTENIQGWNYAIFKDTHILQPQPNEWALGVDTSDSFFVSSYVGASGIERLSMRRDNGNMGMGIYSGFSADAPLDVGAELRLGISSPALECTSSIEGAIRYSSGAGVQYCDGTNWSYFSIIAGIYGKVPSAGSSYCTICTNLGNMTFTSSGCGIGYKLVACMISPGAYYASKGYLLTVDNPDNPTKCVLKIAELKCSPGGIGVYATSICVKF